MSEAPRFDLLSIEDETRPYWEAAAEGRLLLTRCSTCEVVHHPPRPFCPSCWSEDVAWVEASGRATLYTWSTIRDNDLPPWNDRVPYVAAVVELDEGPKMVTQVIGCAPDALAIGMALEVAFEALDEHVTVPVFRPAA